MADKYITLDNLSLFKGKLDEKYQQTVQYSTMPDAADHNGEIIQYTGATTLDFIKGYFYQSNGTNWVQIEVSAGNMNNPMDNVGDLIVGGVNGIPTKLAKSNTVGQVLKTTANGLEWADGGSGAIANGVCYTEIV